MRGFKEILPGILERGELRKIKKMVIDNNDIAKRLFFRSIVYHYCIDTLKMTPIEAAEFVLSDEVESVQIETVVE
jgi:hypothetical protein